MAKNIKTKQQDDLGKGVNLFTRDTMIADNECVDGWNCWAVGKNSIAKRPGVVKFCEVDGASQVDGIGVYYSGATRKLLVMANGMLYDCSTGTPSRIGSQTWTAGNRVSFCQAGGSVYIANGVETLRAYNGSTTADVTGGIVAKYIIYYKSCIWAWGNPTSGNETRLYRSGTDVNLGNFTYTNPKTGTTTSTTANKLVDSSGNFTTANVTVGTAVFNLTTGVSALVSAIDSTTTLSVDKDIFISGNTYSIINNSLATSVYVSKADGQYLNGAFKHQDFLYPVKERSLWRLSVGTDAYQLIQLELVDPARGTDSHHTIDTVENDNFMFNEVGVFATGYEPNILDQIRTNIVSLRVDPKIKAIQKDRLDDVVGIFFDNHYYLSFTSGGGTYNDTFLIYDRQRLGWWEFQVSDDSGNYIGANILCDWKNTDGETKLYFGSPTDGSVYYFDETVKQDVNYTIASQWLSKKYGLEKEYSQSKFFLSVIVYVGKVSGSFDIYCYVDGTLADTKSVRVGAAGFAGMGVEETGVEIVGLGGGSMDITDTGGGTFIQLNPIKLGKTIQFKITDNSNKFWEINSISVNYKPINPLYNPEVL
jgi:hypothetical protein